MSEIPTGDEHEGETDASKAAGPERPGLVEEVSAPSKWTHEKKRHHAWRWRLLREHDEPPVSLLNPAEDPEPGRIGICCSGGGIRSASFNLGALQAIQDKKILVETTYLAAVSGGSYIAAAFAMVSNTRVGGPDDPPNSNPDLFAAVPPFGPGSPEEQYLRNRASYIAPTGSAKAYLIWRIVLGLLVNLVLIGAVLVVVAFALSWYYRHQDKGLIRPPPLGVTPGASPNMRIVAAGLGLSALALVLGCLSILMRPRDWGVVQRLLEVWSLPLFALGLLIFALELVVPDVIDALRPDTMHTQGGLRARNGWGAGLSASVVGIVGAIVVQLRAQVADPVKAIGEAKTWVAGLGSRARLVFVYLATWVLGPLLIFAMLVAAIMLQVETTDVWLRVAAPVAAGLVLVLFQRFGDVNSWSLHPFYRARLGSAFALRRIESPGDPKTGHAEQRPESEYVPLSKTTVASDNAKWPKLVVCAAANISDPGASPPGRGVTSFTFSSDELGGPLVGGVETEKFEAALSPKRRRDLTLLAAVAMSGAAISPSMGKLTRPSLRFLMGMANVRLGVWLPNPRRMESFALPIRQHMRSEADGVVGKTKATFTRTASLSAETQARVLEEPKPKRAFVPRPTARYLLKELLGWNSVNDKFLYVTDGGHYENLGLVELLRRGCTELYVFDASGGNPLGALGDAIALARSELGVEVEFPDEELARLRPGEKAFAAAGCATGTVRFTRSTGGPVDPNDQVTGTIVYAPTVMTAALPWDVHAFKEKDPVFPNHSTVDQLFTDQKFEAYRVLGNYAGRSAIEAMHPSDLPGDDSPTPEA